VLAGRRENLASLPRPTCFDHQVPRASDVAVRLAELADRYGLPATATQRLALLLDLVEQEPSAITGVRDPADGVDVHVADSLVALELPVVRAARAVADLGSGGGFPGLPLAIALPEAHVVLVESAGRKCAFLRAAVERLELPNVDVVNARAEQWPAGLEVHDLVTARALAPLPVLVEYAAPLLRLGGALVAWKGRRNATDEIDAAAAATVMGMGSPESRPVAPFPAANARHLYLSSKVSPTPRQYPRRVGMARKRPLRASTRP
jgi:16S rRNA (guanine527-N7)-methyltransferase